MRSSLWDPSLFRFSELLYLCYFQLLLTGYQAFRSHLPARKRKHPRWFSFSLVDSLARKAESKIYQKVRSNRESLVTLQLDEGAVWCHNYDALRQKKIKKDRKLHEKPNPLGVSCCLVPFPTATCDAEHSACTGHPSSSEGNWVIDL